MIRSAGNRTALPSISFDVAAGGSEVEGGFDVYWLFR